MEADSEFDFSPLDALAGICGSVGTVSLDDSVANDADQEFDDKGEEEEYEGEEEETESDEEHSEGEDEEEGEEEEDEGKRGYLDIGINVAITDSQLSRLERAAAQSGIPLRPARFRQSVISFGGTTAPTRPAKKRMRTPLPPRPEPVADNDWLAEMDEEKRKAFKIPASEQAMARHFNPVWKLQYPWLTLEFDPKLMQYGMKCKVCKTHAPHTKSPFGRGGAGGRDFQKNACKSHDHSKVHLAAMTAERLAQGTETVQHNQGCPDLKNDDTYGRYFSR
ncbi:unnamed protein product [Closterium sp. NIES-65]|nr:unnamed protein product [Closterium sp. NIES-65]